MPAAAPSFSEGLRYGVEIFHALRGILKKKGHSTGVGDEGGFAPNLKANQEAVDVVLEAVDCRRLQGGLGRVHRARRRRQRAVERQDPQVRFQEVRREDADVRRNDRALAGLGAAVSDRLDRGRPRRGRLGRLEGADRARWATASSSSATTCSSPIRRSSSGASATASCNAILVKLNQIGTVTETLDAVAMARDASYAAVISHRSGETEDTTIADLAVGTGAGQIKTGSASRSDRVAKYNQLLRIEEELGASARYAGQEAPSRTLTLQLQLQFSIQMSPLVLLVLDGFGIREEREHNAIALARTPVYDELLARYPHASLDRLGRSRRAARRPDGQLRGRPHEHGGGADRLPGPHADRQGDPGRRSRVATHVLDGVDVAVRRRSQRASLHRPRLGRRRPQPSAAPARADRARRQAPHCRASSSTRSPMAAMRRRPAASATSRSSKQALRRPAPGASQRSSGATTRWIATSGGSGRRWPTKRSSAALAETTSRSALDAVSASHAAGVTDEFIRPVVIVAADGAADRARSATAIRSSSSTSAPTARGSSRGPSPSTISTASTAAPIPASTSRR